MCQKNFTYDTPNVKKSFGLIHQTRVYLLFCLSVQSTVHPTRWVCIQDTRCFAWGFRQDGLSEGVGKIRWRVTSIASLCVTTASAKVLTNVDPLLRWGSLFADAASRWIQHQMWLELLGELLRPRMISIMLCKYLFKWDFSVWTQKSIKVIPKLNYCTFKKFQHKLWAEYRKLNQRMIFHFKPFHLTPVEGPRIHRNLHWEF